MTKHLYAAIMAGGSGTRFWPASRKAHPKQFLDVTNSGRSLLQQTYDRFGTFMESDKIKVVSGENYSEAILKQTDGNSGTLITEPMMRNTSAAVALTAFEISVLKPDAIIVMSPADHLIEREDAFQKTIMCCAEFASKHDALITLGVKPTHAHTGYGYIKRGSSEGELFRVENFTEKPDKKRAEEFLHSGDYFWNAGIFLWSVKSILKAFFEHAPEIYEPLAALYKKGKPSAEELKMVYRELPSVSVDYTILEKAENVYTCPADLGWSDLGSWKTIYDTSPKNNSGHAVGKSLISEIDSRNCFVRGREGKLYALIGMEEIGIIEMEDVTLVFPLSRDQEVKSLLEKVREEQGDQYD